jgi:hypothetical protein
MAQAEPFAAKSSWSWMWETTAGYTTGVKLEPGDIVAAREAIPLTDFTVDPREFKDSTLTRRTHCSSHNPMVWTNKPTS